MSDLDLDDVQRLDGQSMLVSRGYAIEGLTAFTLRATHEGKAILIGPDLGGKRQQIVDMLRDAATQVELGLWAGWSPEEYN